jgi:hypothetical protein
MKLVSRDTSLHPETQSPTALSLMTSLRQTPIMDVTIKSLRAMRLKLTGKTKKKIGSRVDQDLLSTVKTRLNVTSDTEAIELALVNMAITDDFGSWLVSQAGKLPEDFNLEF